MKRFICIILTAILAIGVLTACTSTAAIPEEWSKPGEYPIKPGDPEWTQMKTQQELDAAVNMPLKIAKKLSTDDLAVWAINYPFVIDLYVYDNVNMGFELLQKRSNVLAELFNRDDVVDALLKAYEGLQVDYSSYGVEGSAYEGNIMNEKFVLSYFALNKSTMTDEQLKKLYDIIERNLAATDNEDIKNFLGVSNLGERPDNLK